MAVLDYTKRLDDGSDAIAVSEAQDEADSAAPPFSINLYLTLGFIFFYFLAGKLGLLFASIQPNSTAVWPPTGIALGACLLLGYGIGPAIFIGAFLVNLTTAGSIATSLGIAAGNMLEALAGAYLINRFANGRNVFSRSRDVFKFMLVAAFVSTMVSATIGVASLSLGGYASWSHFGRVWFTWWLGDAAGDVLFAPLVVLWGLNRRFEWDRTQAVEAGLLLVSTVLVAGLVFGNGLPADIQHRDIGFLCIPFLVWAAFRFGPRETASVSFVLFVISVAGTIDGFGPFADIEPNSAFLLLLAFLGVLSLTALTVAAGVAQRRLADEARAGLAAIVASSDDAIISKGLDGRIESWNASAQRMFGYTLAEAIGQPIGLIIPSGRLEQEERDVLELLRRGGAVKVTETVRRHKDGHLVDISLAVSPIKDSDGRVIGASSIARDISEHKRMVEALRASEQKFHEMAETVPDILFTNGADGTTDYTNQRFYDYTGLPNGAGEGLGWMVALHPEDAEQARLGWQRWINRGQPFHIEFRLKAANETYRWFMGRARPIRDAQGRVIKWFGSVTDIDEQKRVQEEREALLRAEQIARAEAEEANRAKDEFLAMLGHELRNPLGAIVSSLEIVENFGADGGPSIRARQVMSRQLKHLVRLVDDLLDVARVTRGKIDLACQPIDMAENVKACVGALGERLSSYDLKVEVEPVWVSGDRTRLEQVLTNLLRNALDYTPAGGRIRISLKDEGEDAVLRVQDSGVGISADLLPRIFDLFVQGKRGLDRSGGGLGVGLTLSKRLVELHGGTMEAASDGRGRGSVFTVRLPRLAPPATRPEVNAVSRVSNIRRRVLIVEDNRDARESLRTILELAGHEVYEAADGPGGVAQALALKPDMALIDIGLPTLDGYAVARQIRSAAGGEDIFLVALTGYGQPRDRGQAQEAGFDAHIVKPVNLARLAEIIAASGRKPPSSGAGLTAAARRA